MTDIEWDDKWHIQNLFSIYLVSSMLTSLKIPSLLSLTKKNDLKINPVRSAVLRISEKIS